MTVSARLLNEIGVFEFCSVTIEDGVLSKVMCLQRAFVSVGVEPHLYFV